MLSAVLAAGVIGWSTSAQGATGTVMLVVINSASLTAQETARKTLMEGWGYTVTPITATATQAAFDTACQSASCAYICEDITSTDLNTKLLGATIPVVNEEQALADDFGFSTGATAYNGTAINITSTTHYITSAFSSGSLTVWSSSQGAQALWYPSGTVGAFTTLAQKVAAANPALEVMERGDALTSGTAAGRRVCLPWGSSVDINALSTNGRTIMQRSIEWCLLPVSRWKLDDASGSTAVDMYGGHNGTVSGAAWTTGKMSGALSFNGTSDYVSVASHADFQVTRAFTITGWVRASAWPNDANYSSVVLRKGDANPNNWQLSIIQGYAAVVMDNYDASAFRGNTLLSLNAWHHVAGTWDGSKVRVYVDGSLDNTPVAYTAALGTDTRAVYIGGRTGATDVIAGKVDDVRFYNRCLTAAEVAALANISPTLTSWENVAP